MVFFKKINFDLENKFNQFKIENFDIINNNLICL